MIRPHLLIGQTLRFLDDPFVTTPCSAVCHEERGAVVLQDGRIVACGTAEDLAAKYPDSERDDYGRSLILAGFIDPHVHYPQTAIIASWGKRLLDWLNDYTFPEEAKFSDPDYASCMARQYLRQLIDHGTTTVCTYCTSHAASVDAFFVEAERLNMRVLAGKTCMDRNVPDALRDTPTSGYQDSKSLLEKWHNKGRLSYVITPRFALTSSPGQLEQLGQLWSEYPECLLQTHLSEQLEEIAEVKRLFPAARDYLDVYDGFGLVRERSLFGHAIHLNDREQARLRDAGSALIHCPTSNLFIGSGLFDMSGLKSPGQPVGLATDIGGGSSYSMLRTMAAAYEISQLKGHALHPSQLVWLATSANARTLHLDSSIGNLAPEREADIIVLDLYSTESIAARAARAESFWEELFPTIMMGDDRAIEAVWVAGRQLKPWPD